MHLPRQVGIASLITLAACAAGKPLVADVASVRAAIVANDRNFERWIGEGAVDSIASGYYTPDAIDFAANSPPSKGSDAIRKLYAGYTAMGAIRAHLEMTDLVLADSLAVDHGTYTLEVRAKPPADSTKVLFSDHGNYVTAFVQRDGKWLALYDIGVTEVPMPPMPAAAASKKK